MQGSRTLPPLILHPFADAAGPEKLVESSRASLMLQGLLPSGERSTEELDRALVDGRYCEIRMLFYLGKDLARWIDQCMEQVGHDPELRSAGIKAQSFGAYLINHTPSGVQAKLRRWGVADYKSIFARALGLNALLADMPEPHVLADEFIRNYYRYADELFRCRQAQVPFTELEESRFQFEIYASGEYSRMLEREWAENAAPAEER